MEAPSKSFARERKLGTLRHPRPVLPIPDHCPRITQRTVDRLPALVHADRYTQLTGHVLDGSSFQSHHVLDPDALPSVHRRTTLAQRASVGSSTGRLPPIVAHRAPQGDMAASRAAQSVMVVRGVSPGVGGAKTARAAAEHVRQQRLKLTEPYRKSEFMDHYASIIA